MTGEIPGHALADTGIRELLEHATVSHELLPLVCGVMRSLRYSASSPTSSITEAKNNLSALIDSVKGGSPVLIVDCGRPVARLEPVSALRSDDNVWDASAIVPLLIAETTTPSVQTLAAKDAAMLVWWATEVECASAIARLAREGALDEAALREAFQRLTQLATGWHEVDPSDAIRETAVRFRRVHPMRAADGHALQLAAAFIAAEPRPSCV